MGWSLSFANLPQVLEDEWVSKEGWRMEEWIEGGDKRGRGDVLCTANNMAPLHTHFIPSFDVNDFARRRGVGVTSDVPVVDV
jgi:hypothetical protein